MDQGHCYTADVGGAAGTKGRRATLVFKEWGDMNWTSQEKPKEINLWQCYRQRCHCLKTREVYGTYRD